MSEVAQNGYPDNNIKQILRPRKPIIGRPEEDKSMRKAYLPHAIGTSDKKT